MWQNCSPGFPYSTALHPGARDFQIKSLALLAHVSPRTKQEILLGKGIQVESSRVREPRRIALGFYGDGISFRVVFSQSF